MPNRPRKMAAPARIFTEVNKRLSRRYPEVFIRVTTASAEPLEYPELRERKVDVVLARISKAFAHADLGVEKLFDDPPRVGVGALSPWARRRKVTLADLVADGGLSRPIRSSMIWSARRSSRKDWKLPKKR